MPGLGESHPLYYQSLRRANVFKSVNATYNTINAVAIWTPATGKKFLLMGGVVKAVCTAICNGSEAAGQQLVLCDSVVTVPLVTVGVLGTDDVVAGSIWPGPETTDNAPVPNTQVYFTDPGPLPFNFQEGYRSATANNALKFALSDGAAVVNIGTTGIIRIVGTVWGRET